jgi:hypothetical protein
MVSNHLKILLRRSKYSRVIHYKSFIHPCVCICLHDLDSCWCSHLLPTLSNSLHDWLSFVDSSTWRKIKYTIYWVEINREGRLSYQGSLTCCLSHISFSLSRFFESHQRGKWLQRLMGGIQRMSRTKAGTLQSMNVRQPCLCMNTQRCSSSTVISSIQKTLRAIDYISGPSQINTQKQKTYFQSCW